MFRRILILVAAFLVVVAAPVAAQDDADGGYGPTSMVDGGADVGGDTVVPDDDGAAVGTGDDGALARTGSDYVGILVPLGAGLLTVGGLVLLSTRKRSVATSAA